MGNIYEYLFNELHKSLYAAYFNQVYPTADCVIAY